MRKLRHRGTQDVCLAWYLMGSRAGMEGATGLSASKPSFLWLYQSTSKQEGLTMTAQEKMVWRENSAVRFWALLTCQSLFWVKNSHCSFSVDPDLYLTMKTEGLLTISSPRALNWESSWPLLTSRGFSVLPQGQDSSGVSQALAVNQVQGTEAGGQRTHANYSALTSADLCNNNWLIYQFPNGVYYNKKMTFFFIFMSLPSLIPNTQSWSSSKANTAL